MLAGCGGGGGAGQTTTTVASSPPTSATTTAETSSFELSQTIESITTATSSNEQQSGDEVPISTQALFTGNGGRITPAKIQVPPFIAVTVVLRSADGRLYSIVVGGRGMATNGRARVKLPGLRPEARYVAINQKGTPRRLVIEASAEPGP